MDPIGFACPTCAEQTGTVVATADCGACHALCPCCAEKWFSSCSRCPMCNASVSTINVHLLSAVVEEGESHDMARFITEASLARIVFSVRAQTQLKADVMDEAEVMASLPTEICQACHTDSGRNPLRCVSCGDPYHLRCCGLRRRPRHDWCCPTCHAVEPPAPEAKASEDSGGETSGPSHASSDDASGRPTLRSSANRQARRGEHPVGDADAILGPQPAASVHVADRSAGPSGGIHSASEAQSNCPTVQMGVLSEKKMESAISNLHALRRQQKESDLQSVPSKQKRPRVRKRGQVWLPASGTTDCLDGAGICNSADSPQPMSACMGQRIHEATTPRVRHTPSVLRRAVAVSQSRQSSASEAYQAAATGSRSVALRQSLPVQGQWVEQANPFKRKVFIRQSRDSARASLASVASRHTAVAAPEPQTRHPVPPGSPLKCSKHSMSNNQRRLSDSCACAHGHPQTCENEQLSGAAVESRRSGQGQQTAGQDATGRVATQSGPSRSRSPMVVDHAQHQQTGSTVHANKSAYAFAATSTRCIPTINQDPSHVCNTPKSAILVQKFSKKLMHKAFRCYAFQSALPEAELSASADHAAELLAARISDAIHPLEQSAAHRLVESVIDQYDLLFSHKHAHCGTVRYVRNELMKFSSAALAR
eukprot:jgi/Ulvmu1/7818/UM004_0047.1